MREKFACIMLMNLVESPWLSPGMFPSLKSLESFVQTLPLLACSCFQLPSGRSGTAPVFLLHTAKNTCGSLSQSLDFTSLFYVPGFVEDADVCTWYSFRRKKDPSNLWQVMSRPNNFQSLGQCCTAACKEPSLLSRMSVRQVVRANTCSDSRLCVGNRAALVMKKHSRNQGAFENAINYYVTNLIAGSELFSCNDSCASYLHFAIVPLSILLPEHQQQFPTENSYGHDITSIQNS